MATPMSSIEVENANLKQQLEGLNAQIEAIKGMLNESTNNQMITRTNMIFFQKKFQESDNQNKELTKKIAELEKELEEKKEIKNAVNKEPLKKSA